MRGGRSQHASARILLFDIEIAPIVGTTWATYDTNVVWKIADWYMLCFAYKWHDEKKTHVVAQPDFKGYKAGSTDDYQVVKKLHGLFDQADIVIAHNGNRFDIKKANARFLFHKLAPPSPYQKVDTLAVARRHFGFTSNKLDELGQTLGVGKKLESGMALWRGCMDGDKKSWKKMCDYNKQDVILLEKVYLKLLPYDTSHPNMANIEGRPAACPKCGHEGFMQAMGYRHTKTATYRRFQCGKCRSYLSQRTAEKTVRPDYV